MANDNGWPEHKKLILSKLDEHGEAIDKIEGNVNKINIAMTPIPKIADSVEQLLLNKAKEEGVREASGVHHLPPEFPTASAEIRVEKGGWKDSLTKNLKLILVVLAILAAAGIYPTVTWATKSPADATSVEPEEVKTLMEQQKTLIENINKLIQSHEVKTNKSDMAIANEDKDRSPGG